MMEVFLSNNISNRIKFKKKILIKLFLQFLLGETNDHIFLTLHETNIWSIHMRSIVTNSKYFI